MDQEQFDHIIRVFAIVRVVDWLVTKLSRLREKGPRPGDS